MNLFSITAAIMATASLVSSKVYFQEDFNDENWETRWSVPSENTNQLGSWGLNSGKFFADKEINRGLRTETNMRFYALTSPLIETFDNEGKDLVLQFSAKNEQGLNCGGAYIKLLAEPANVQSFNGQSAYKIMFGPDVCGPNRRVHLILEKGGSNHMIKKKIDFSNDELTHMYTLVVSQPTQTYRILIDGAEVASGNLFDDLEDMSDVPRLIADPAAVKPADWEDREFIVDAEDVKPADWEESRTIPDPDATQPEDWNEATQGTWTPPQIPNPDYHEWTPRMIKNPAYKGEWTAPLVPNPEFKADTTVAAYSKLSHVAFDLWQVKAGTIFDNFLVSDDFSEAQKVLDTLFTPLRELEYAAERAYFKSLHPDAAEEAEKMASEPLTFNEEGDSDTLGNSSEEEHTEL